MFGILFVGFGFFGLFGTWLMFSGWSVFWDSQDSRYETTQAPVRWLWWNSHRWWPRRLDSQMRWVQTTLMFAGSIASILLGITMLLGA